MKIAIASSSTLALPIISTLGEAGYSIVGIITNPDKPSGRGRIITPNALAQEMSQFSFPLLKPATHHELATIVTELSPDLVITIAYGRIVRSESLVIPRLGWINLHFSLLPAYRGAAPVQRAILDGATKTGVSVFQLDAGMDTGDIYATQAVAIEENETSGELLSRLAPIGAELLLTALKLIEKGIEATPQPSEGVSLAPKIEVSEARIDWNSGTSKVHSKIRAMTPEPGAWTLLNGHRYIIGRSRKYSEKLMPGEIRTHQNQLLIGTGDGSISVQELQPSGKKMMSSVDWLRGARIDRNSRFE